MSLLNKNKDKKRKQRKNRLENVIYKYKSKSN